MPIISFAMRKPKGWAKVGRRPTFSELIYRYVCLVKWLDMIIKDTYTSNMQYYTSLRKKIFLTFLCLSLLSDWNFFFQNIVVEGFFPIFSFDKNKTRYNIFTNEMKFSILINWITTMVYECFKNGKIVHLQLHVLHIWMVTMSHRPWSSTMPGK